MTVRSVEAAVTHEIVIDGEKSWIKYGVTVELGPNEFEKDARERALRYANQGVMEAIEQTVETVRKATT